MTRASKTDDTFRKTVDGIENPRVFKSSRNLATDFYIFRVIYDFEQSIVKVTRHSNLIKFS